MAQAVKRRPGRRWRARRWITSHFPSSGSRRHIDIRPQFCRIGLGIGLRELRRLENDRADLWIDLLEFLLGRSRSRSGASSPARSDRPPRASSALLPWRDIWPGPTWNGRDSDRSSFRGCRAHAPARQWATALSPAALTARTSMPSTCSPGMPKTEPRLNSSSDLAAGAADRRAHGIAVVLDDEDRPAASTATPC